MSQESVEQVDGVAESDTPSRRDSGVQRILAEERAQSRVASAEGWPTMLDQDSIPTQPANDSPKPPSVPAPSCEHRETMIDIPPASFEDLRDTIPSPPPEHEHD